MSLTPRRIALTCAFIFRASPRYLERLTQPMCETFARIRGALAARPRGTPLVEVGCVGECIEDVSPRALDDARDDDLPVRLAVSFACHLHAPFAEFSSRTR